MRPQDWPERLADYLAAALDSPFEWGQHDCAAFAAGWVEALTGERPPLPSYSSALEAARLADAGGGLEQIVSQVLGAPLDRPEAAMRGDVVLVETGGRLALGVVVGSHVAGPGAEGLAMEPRSAIRAAWSV